MWEDERNRRGGRWLITLSKQQRKSDLDQFWLETVSSDVVYIKICIYTYEYKATLFFFFVCLFFRQLLCLVGEAFDNFSDDVCGAVINVRAKGDKMAIWTTNYENKEAVTHIG